MPDPCFVNDPAVAVVAPLNAVDAVTVPKVRPLVPRSMAPAPLKSPIVVDAGVMPLMLKVPLLVTAPAAANAPEPLKANVPALMVVPPV